MKDLTSDVTVRHKSLADSGLLLLKSCRVCLVLAIIRWTWSCDYAKQDQDLFWASLFRARFTYNIKIKTAA